MMSCWDSHAVRPRQRHQPAAANISSTAVVGSEISAFALEFRAGFAILRRFSSIRVPAAILRFKVEVAVSII
jgi:hypothetical protein